jgi:hypothetical protein
LRFDGGDWEIVDPIGDGTPRAVDHLTVAPDGSLWAHLHGCIGEVKLDLRVLESPCAELRDPYLVHHDGNGWTVYSAANGVPMLGSILNDNWGALAVSGDGTVWTSTFCQPEETDSQFPCDPARQHDLVHAFDGERWRSYIAEDTYGYAVSIDVAPDGMVWVWAFNGNEDRLYRIDPRVADA